MFPIVSDTGSPTATVPGPAPRISSLLIKPASAVCNLDCEYCFYLDRDADPYKELPARAMSVDTLERLVDSYMFYAYPNTAFGFQGGEPTLVGVDFFRKLVEFQKRYGRSGQTVSNSIQTNGILIDRDWCELLREYNFLVGLSLDGPESVHDEFRFNKGGQGTWTRVMETVELFQKEKVEFNILCVLSSANVGKATELYRFFRKLGVEYMQFIPLAEFHPDGSPMPYTVTPEDYGKFLCEVFDLWWPERRKVRIRFFDNIAEAVAGQKPANCTMHESCDSYVVVEYNGDVYPCDFFVEGGWKLGNIEMDSWPEIARRQRRYNFAGKKSVPHEECAVCEYKRICHGGCPKLRHGPHKRFEDLDWFCGSYKQIFAKSVPKLEPEVRKILASHAQASSRVGQ